MPRLLSPWRLRAGPSPLKAPADAALAAAFAAAHRRRRFEVALAHNAEAALAALAVRPLTRVPVIYVAHTLLGYELATYGPPALGATLDAAGRTLDRWIASRVDGVVALGRRAERALAPHARGPLAVIPPGLDPAPDPEPASVAGACARFGLEPGRFALYAGNLDRYQALEDLAGAARRIPDIPVVAATQAAARRSAGALRIARVADAREARALTFGAGVAVLPRRLPGGFPVKLLNYMEARRAIVARAGIAEGLEHGRSAWLLRPEATDAELADAIRALLDDPGRAARLGRAARAQLEAQHAWPDLARRTLELAGEVRRRARGR